MLVPLLVWRPMASYIYLVPLPFYIIVSLLFYQRRKMHPIQGRFPPIVHLLNTGLFMVGCFEGYTNLSASQPCFVRQFTFMIFIPIGLGTLGLRCWALLWSYEMQQDVHQIERATGGERLAIQWRQNWYTRNRWVMKRKIFYRIELVTLIILTAVWIIVTACFGSFTDPCGAPHTPNGSTLSLNLTNALIAMWVVLPLLFLAVGAWKLRRHKIDDNFGLSHELRVMLVCSSLLTIAGIILLLQGASTLVMPALLSGASICFMMTMTVYPLYLSVRFARSQRLQAASLQRITRLADLLTFPQGYLLFLQFTQTEFCSELLYFWRHVEQYRANTLSLANCDEQITSSILNDTLLKAMSLFETYLLPSSPFEVNISAQCRVDTAQQLGRLWRRIHGDASSLPLSLVTASSPTAAMIRAFAARSAKEKAETGFAAANHAQQSQHGQYGHSRHNINSAINSNNISSVPLVNVAATPVTAITAIAATNNAVIAISGANSATAVSVASSSRPSSNSGKGRATETIVRPLTSGELAVATVATSADNASTTIVANTNTTTAHTNGILNMDHNDDTIPNVITVTTASSSSSSSASLSCSIAPAASIRSEITASIASSSSSSLWRDNIAASSGAYISHGRNTSNVASRYLVDMTSPSSSLVSPIINAQHNNERHNNHWQRDHNTRDDRNTGVMDATSLLITPPSSLPLPLPLALVGANGSLSSPGVPLMVSTNIGTIASSSSSISAASGAFMTAANNGNNSNNNGTSVQLSSSMIRLIRAPHPLLLSMSTIFDDAQSMVLDLLQSNSFVRFRAGRMFKAFIAELEKGTTTQDAVKQVTNDVNYLTSANNMGDHDHDDMRSMSAVKSSNMRTPGAIRPQLPGAID